MRTDPLPGPTYTTEQARTHVVLTRAIQDQIGDGVTIPCTQDPGTWDADDTVQGDELEIKRAARLCKTACPVFGLCAAFVATDPPLHGIVAGQYRRHPLDYRNRDTGRQLGRDRKTEWAAEAGTDNEGRAA
ncbi:hypothetical protein [Microlunatus speluncae]|uniref:hypothetical protein n=1 Tax=Microlunatus speluncae TaxID=2594267 RepID=UPI001266612D|nr:hypothetical protein [Microlunatus speluncae]